MSLFNYKKEEMQIKGLSYIDNWINLEQSSNLIQFIDNQNWMNDLKRRVQHYGYIYDYKKRFVDKQSYLGKLPEPLNELALKLQELSGELPDQCIINEYLPGQGIYRHVDCEPCFTDWIYSLSLISPIIMNITSVPDEKLKKELILKPNSLLILTDEARYNWFHGIKSQNYDLINGQKIMRTRRVSITFRKVILN